MSQLSTLFAIILIFDTVSMGGKKETIVDAQTQPYRKKKIASSFRVANIFYATSRKQLTFVECFFLFIIISSKYSIKPNEPLTACLAISVEAMFECAAVRPEPLTTSLSKAKERASGQMA